LLQIHRVFVNQGSIKIVLAGIAEHEVPIGAVLGDARVVRGFL
jgi:hypothetical protein